jgi:hypothetical protein
LSATLFLVSHSRIYLQLRKHGKRIYHYFLDPIFSLETMADDIDMDVHLENFINKA